MPHKDKEIWAVIPALNEEETIFDVVSGAMAHVSSVLVVDNDSSDRTSLYAKMAGARVVKEPCKGYGAACQRGIKFLSSVNPYAVVFLSGDGSDDPADIPKVLAPILFEGYHLALGRRSLKSHEALFQRLGNQLIIFLLNRCLSTNFSDLGPLRAILWEELVGLRLKDHGFAWTLEMQIKAFKKGLRIKEVPVENRPRQGGRQKISGTFWGTWRAGIDLMNCMGREILRA